VTYGRVWVEFQRCSPIWGKGLPIWQRNLGDLCSKGIYQAGKTFGV